MTKQLFGGDWTEQKLEILRNYLCSYNTVLKKQPFIRVYVDAFAGTGYRQQRLDQYGVLNLFDETGQGESQQFLKGSAKLALEIVPSFHKYIFVESDAGKVAELEKLRLQHPDKVKQIEIIRQDANQFVQQYCATENWRQVRAVMFLDPFATEVVWETIKSIAQTQAIDMWLLFPLMAINRLLAQDPAKACRDRLDKIFGTNEWFERFYQTKRMDDIFGKPLEMIEKKCSFASIGTFFQERLKTVFVAVAETPGILKNSKTPLFQFFCAAGNPKGAKIAIRIAEHLLKEL